MTVIYFIRHAEPDLSEHRDALRPLSEKGRNDRALVSRFLSDKGVEVIYSSPYLRAKQTIEDYAEKRSIGIICIDDLRERKVGNEWIEDFAGFAERQWADRDYHLKDGESLDEVEKRQTSVLSSILEAHSGKIIAVGSHGTAMSVLINHFDRSFGYEDFRQMNMPHAAEFVFDDEGKCVNLILNDLFTGEMQQRIP